MPLNDSVETLPPPEPPFAWFSPTLARIAEEQRPRPLPACASCPASGWYTTPRQLKCYCTSYGLTVWNRSDDPVTACDGREKALVLFAAETK